MRRFRQRVVRCGQGSGINFAPCACMASLSYHSQHSATFCVVCKLNTHSATFCVVCKLNTHSVTFTTMVNVKANRIAMFVFLALSVATQLLAAGVGAGVGWNANLQAPALSPRYDPSAGGTPPQWFFALPSQIAGRTGAGALSATALFPLLLIAIIIFYAGVKGKQVSSGNAIKSSFPEAALWTTVGVSLVCMVTNFATVPSVIPDLTGGSLGFDPALVEAPVSYGISATNVVLSLGALGMTIAALVKQ